MPRMSNYPMSHIENCEKRGHEQHLVQSTSTETMTKLRWGLIGAGDIVRKRVAAALRDTPHSELAAISRRDAASAVRTAAELRVPLFFTEWRDLVRSPDVDAVYIATPVYLHAEQTIAAAEAGKHV